MLSETVCRSFEEQLVNYCSPTLSGLKASNLISLKGRQRDEYRMLAAEYGRKLDILGISLRVLCECEKNMLLLVYKKELMSVTLAEKKTLNLLKDEGYPIDGSTDDMLDCLTKRIGNSCDFPHEIGLFLGYPSDDVEGFIAYKGRKYICSGYWKVYSDAIRAMRIFESYDRCRHFMSGLLSGGMPLIEILNTI